MWVLKTIKSIFHPDEIITGFVLENKYPKTTKKIDWILKMLAKKEITITKISYTIQETIKLPKEEKKEDIVTTIWTKAIAWPIYLEPFKEFHAEFSVPINISKKKQTEKKVYKWDYALMNRAHDQSKQTIFLYKIIAKIKRKWERKTLDISNDILID